MVHRLKSVCRKVGRLCPVCQILYLPETPGLIDSLTRNFRIIYGKGLSINCSAFRLDKMTGRQGQLQTYSEQEVAIPFLRWVEQIMKNACTA